MATLNRLKPGQIVYSVERQKMGNTSLRRVVLYKIEIKEVNVEGGYVLASCNNNPVRRYSGRSITKWKINKPKPKHTIMGMPSY